MLTFKKIMNAFVLFLFVTEVAPWTIDLQEVKKSFLEEHERQKVRIEESNYYNHNHGNKRSSDEDVKVDNAENVNEFHESYMGKKVLEVVHNGGVYLEGLQRALEDYILLIEQCNSRNTSIPQNSSWLPPVFPMSSNQTLPYGSPPSKQFQNLNLTEMLGPNTSGSSKDSLKSNMTCEDATAVSEKVRQFANLATWATKRLQDLAYAKQYQKTDYYEENELILKLAWFLDQLAVLTGYEPDYQRYLPSETTSTTTARPSPMTLVPQTQELVDFLTSCLKMNSSEPATVRCKYKLPLPDIIADIVGITSPSTEPASTSPTEDIPEQPTEILITGEKESPKRITKRSAAPNEYIYPLHLPVHHEHHHESPVHHDKHKPPVIDFIVKKLANLKEIVKTVKKNAFADFTSQIAIHKHLHKRAIDENTASLLNRLVKKNDEAEFKSDEKIVEPVISLDSIDQPIVKSEELTVKSDALPVKSNASDAQTIKSVNIEDIPQLYYPTAEVSVVNTKSFKKRSIDNSNQASDVTVVKSVKKRSTTNPLADLTNFYLKYKIWDSANSIQTQNIENPTNFDVKNAVPRIITKRSIPKNNNWPQTKHKYSNKNAKLKLVSYQNRMLDKKQKKILKTKRQVSKRSINYRRVYKPRIPDNPVGDISYYVKNRKGLKYKPSLEEAALVRALLQQHFETGNTAVVHRFGSNYNPLVPAHFAAGILKAIADS